MANRQDNRQASKTVATNGGAYVGGNATAGGDIVGRDKIITTYTTINQLLTKIETTNRYTLLTYLRQLSKNERTAEKGELAIVSSRLKR